MRWLVILALAGSGCAAHARPPASSSAAAQQRLATADALVNEGCFDCLLEARRGYGALTNTVVRHAALMGVVRADGLLALRATELGWSRDSYLAEAHAVLAQNPTLQSAAIALEIIGSLPSAASLDLSSRETERSLAMHAAENRDRWRETLRSNLNSDVLWAYTSLSFECTSWIGTPTTIEQSVSGLGDSRKLPIIAFKLAICSSPGAVDLSMFQAAHPRFTEAAFFLGRQAMLARDLDAADEQFTRAYRWHADWPQVTKPLADVAMQSEDFARAVLYFDRTLAMVAVPDAELGKLQALSRLGEAVDAIRLADAMFNRGSHVGETRYWKAWNEFRQRDLTAARNDAGEARRLQPDAATTKLAGQIALELGQLDAAEEAFEDARSRNPYDCEIVFFLGRIARERHALQRGSDLLSDSALCLEKQQHAVLLDIEQIRQGTHTLERQRRLMDHRVQDVAALKRLASEAWYSAAECAFGLGRFDDVRQFADRIVNRDEFRKAIDDLMNRLK